jgi:hypothetical protein
MGLAGGFTPQALQLVTAHQRRAPSDSLGPRIRVAWLHQSVADRASYMQGPQERYQVISNCRRVAICALRSSRGGMEVTVYAQSRELKQERRDLGLVALQKGCPWLSTT